MKISTQIQRQLSFKNELNLYKSTCRATGKEITSLYPPDTPYVIYAHDIWSGKSWSARDYGHAYDFTKSFFEQFSALQKEVPRSNTGTLSGGTNAECYDCVNCSSCTECYECIECAQLDTCFYCKKCKNSQNLLFCYSLENCSDCIGSVGLTNKKFCIFNQQYTEEEYVKYKKSLNLCYREHVDMLARQLEELLRATPLPTDSAEPTTDDCCLDCSNTTNSYYSDSCKNCHNVFGCIGLRDAHYCILNQQYTKEDYETTVAKIIEQMTQEGTWKTFFPESMSPFAYNDSLAQVYVPLTKEEVLAKGLQWREADAKEFGPQNLVVPYEIAEVPDSICYEILACEKTGRNFCVTPTELIFLRRHNLPVPRLHSRERLRLKSY